MYITIKHKKVEENETVLIALKILLFFVIKSRSIILTYSHGWDRVTRLWVTNPSYVSKITLWKVLYEKIVILLYTQNKIKYHKAKRPCNILAKNIHKIYPSENKTDKNEKMYLLGTFKISTEDTRYKFILFL